MSGALIERGAAVLRNPVRQRPPPKNETALNGWLYTVSVVYPRAACKTLRIWEGIDAVPNLTVGLCPGGLTPEYRRPSDVPNGKYTVLWTL
jgi:hypothetical protein